MLFEVCVPVVESIGWTLNNVEKRAPGVLGMEVGSSGNGGWFKFPSPAHPAGDHETHVFRVACVA